MHSRTSRALPTARPSGASIDVISASVLSPFARPLATIESASLRASSRVFMNAPRPHFTSMTNPVIPSAIFFDRIDAVMSGMLSTVPVTSAQGVQLFVGRRDLCRLADHRRPDRPEHGRELGDRQVDAKAGNRLELVERAARVAQTAAGHHWYDHAAGRRQRGEYEGRLVTNAAGRMFVHLGAGHVGQVEDGPGVGHGGGKRGRFRVRHAAQIDRHEQGR